ncbi:MAG: 2-dehydropantoate 2-reductase N-terminal domain-containing protein [Acidimicrobiales bacterium]
MPESTARRSIAIIGAGRVGSAFAFQLARAGHEITVIARPGSGRLEQLRRDRGILRDTGEKAQVSIADALDTATTFDIVLVTVLAHQVDAILPDLRASAAKQIHFMFVTPDYQRLTETLAPKRATFGMAAVLSVIKPDGRLNMEIPKSKAMQGDEDFVALMKAAGMPAEYEPEAGRWLRSQTPLTIAMTSVTGTGMQHQKGATFSEARVGARGLKAAFDIIKAQGETAYPKNKAQMSRMPTPLLAVILRGVSRSRYRETVGNSSEETCGLIQLLTAEAAHKPELRQQIDAVLALHPNNQQLTDAPDPSHLT